MGYKMRKMKRWLMLKLDPDYTPNFMRIFPQNIKTVSTSTALNQASYAFLQTAKGQRKFDALYGLTRQLADELKDMVTYTEKYNPDRDEWVLSVSLEVIDRRC